jgi:hypothetical protein
LKNPSSRSLRTAFRPAHPAYRLGEAGCRYAADRPERTRDHLLRLGIAVRSTGHNTPAGRRARTSLNGQTTAQRVGTTDITAWLINQRTTGATLRELANATGRSIPWITNRLRRAPEVE